MNLRVEPVRQTLVFQELGIQFLPAKPCALIAFDDRSGEGRGQIVQVVIRRPVSNNAMLVSTRSRKRRIGFGVVDAGSGHCRASDPAAPCPSFLRILPRRDLIGPQPLTLHPLTPSGPPGPNS
jgi:hypothetical protein